MQQSMKIEFLNTLPIPKINLALNDLYRKINADLLKNFANELKNSFTDTNYSVTTKGRLGESFSYIMINCSEWKFCLTILFEKQYIPTINMDILDDYKTDINRTSYKEEISKTIGILDLENQNNTSLYGSLWKSGYLDLFYSDNYMEDFKKGEVNKQVKEILDTILERIDKLDYLFIR